MLKKVFLRVLPILTLLAGFLLGLDVNVDSDPWVRNWGKYVNGERPVKDSKPDGDAFPTVAATDFDKLITVHNPADVERRRASLRAHIWRGAKWDMDNRRPEHVTYDITNPLLFSVPNLAQTDEYEVVMEWGINSRIYRLRAKDSRDCLMIYHEGHRVSFFERKEVLADILKRGCDVLAMSMPLTGGLNNHPVVDHPRFGKLPLTDPNKLSLLESSEFSSIAFFVTPVIAALNQALADRPAAKVGMLGFSGGGWTTVLAAALDTRIQSSYVLSGSAPIAVHAAQTDWGDYKQRLARLYEIADYTDLYIMGATVPARKQVHGVVIHDKCCFGGQNYRHFIPPVAARAAAMGGRVDVLVDKEASSHAPQPWMVAAMLDDFLQPPNSGPRVSARGAE